MHNHKKMNKLTLILVAVLGITTIASAQNNCLDFDGADDYVTCGIMNLSNNSFCIEGWFKAETLPGTGDYAFIFGNIIESVDAAHLRINGTSNKLEFVMGTPYGWIVLTSSAVIQTGIWYHVAILSYRNAGGYDYQYIVLNGLVDATAYYTPFFNYSNSTFRIGGSGNTAYLDGLVDEVKVWAGIYRYQSDIRNDMYKEVVGNESGLVAYYKLDETSGTAANDSQSSSNYDGTLTNMAGNEWTTSSAFFGPKNCLDFDGTDDYVDCGSDASLNITDNTICIEAWIYPTDFQSNYWLNTIAGNDDIAVNGYVFRYGSASGRLSFTYANGASWTEITADNVLTLDNWQHVAISYDGINMKLYVNGIEKASTASTGSIDASTVTFKIGASDFPDRHLIGRVDEVRVWGGARTAIEIRENMCKTFTGNESGLVAYYNFDNASGTVLQDFSGNDNDGTLSDMANDDWVSSTAFNTWLNVDNTSWTTTSNWSGGTPGSNDNVGIPDNDGSQPTISSAVSINNLVIGSGSTLTVSSNTLTITENVSNEGTLSVSGTLTNNSASSTFINNGTFTNDGTVTLEDLINNSGKTVDINEEKEMTIEGDLDNDGTITINSDATGTGSLIVDGIAIGNVTTERYVDEATKGYTWHYVSSPVSNQDIDDPWMTSNSILFNDPAYQLYRFDEDTDYWIYYGYEGSEPENFGDATFVDARGYAATRTEAGVFTFTGTVRTDNVNYATTYTTDKGEGCNLVGNPFTSSIGVTSSATSSENFLEENEALLDNSYEAVYIWDEASGYDGSNQDYKTISNAVVGGRVKLDNDYIQPGQAFMVKVVSGGGALAFNENMQAHSTDDFYKEEKETWPSVELIVENDVLFNSTAIGFSENMTPGLDPSYDVGKLKGNPNIALYTRLIEDNGVDFAIQALPDNNIESYVIPVGIDVAESIMCEFSINTESMEGYPIYLEDRLENIVTNLKDENYNTIVTESGIGRFYLHFTDISSIEDCNANITNTIRTYSSNNTIHILNPENKRGEIRILNLFGQKVAQAKLNGDTKQQIQLHVPSGCYLVNVMSNKEIVTKKVVIRQ